MEASANYDLSLMHHDKRAAESVGANDAFANTYFLMGMYERLLREWAGNDMRIKRIGNMRMLSFNEVGDVVTFSGKVREIDSNQVTIDLQSRVGDRPTSSAFSIVTLQARN
jgi:acyl dehydratase